MEPKSAYKIEAGENEERSMGMEGGDSAGASNKVPAYDTGSQKDAGRASDGTSVLSDVEKMKQTTAEDK